MTVRPPLPGQYRNSGEQYISCGRGTVRKGYLFPDELISVVFAQDAAEALLGESRGDHADRGTAGGERSARQRIG